MYKGEHMGLFSRKNDNRISRSRFAEHADVLDAMARDGARVALQQIQEDISMTRKPATYCEVGDWSLYFNDKPIAKYVGSSCGSYGLRYNDYGMADVPEGNSYAFLSAIKPYLERHLRETYKQYFPTASGISVNQTSYSTESKWTDEITKTDVIEIEVRGVSHSNAQPTYKSW